MTGIGKHDPGTTSWLVSFADLIAILLAFFVMVYASQIVEGARWDALAESLSRSLKVDRDSLSPAPTAEKNAEVRPSRPAEKLNYLRALLDGLRRDDPALSAMRISRFDGRIVIALPGDILFEPDSADPLDGAAGKIAAISHLLSNTENRVSVYGHTAPDDSAGAERAAGWRLSIARARHIAQLMSASGFSRNIGSFGVADGHFAELDNIASAAQRNRFARRVDIVIEEEAVIGKAGGK